MINKTVYNPFPARRLIRIGVLMNPAEIIGLSVGGLTIATGLLGGLVWLIRANLAMQKEFKPNGGTSTKDSLNRIETDLRDIRGKLDDHIDWHLDRR